MAFVASSTRSSRLAEYGWLVASARTRRHRPIRADQPGRWCQGSPRMTVTAARGLIRLTRGLGDEAIVDGQQHEREH